MNDLKPALQQAVEACTAAGKFDLATGMVLGAALVVGDKLVDSDKRAVVHALAQVGIQQTHVEKDLMEQVLNLAGLEKDFILEMLEDAKGE